MRAACLRTYLVGVLVLAACGEEPAAIAPTPDVELGSPPAQPVGPPAVPSAGPPARPWTARFVRACSVWAGADAFATPTHVFGCDGAVFDRESGALIEVQPGRPAPDTAVGDVTLTLAEDELVVRDRSLRELGRIALMEAARPEGRQLGRAALALGAEELYAIDVSARSARRLEGGRACRRALAIGWSASGAASCIVPCGSRSCLRTVGRAGEVELAPVHSARWLGSGRILAAGEDHIVRLLGDDGAVLASREATGDFEIRDVASDAALVSRRDTTELWRAAGGTLEVEQVYARRADAASFAGEEIVIAASHGLVWLHRGEARALPELPAPRAPAGMRALRADVDGEHASFEGHGEHLPRGPNDVAAFVRTGRRFTHAIVSRSDALEMSRFAGETDWGRAVAARYLDPGSQRWAKIWRGEEGRVLRGHVYIGGCERTHIVVEVRERRDLLERWMVYTGDGRVDDVLGPIPPDARIVEGVAGDSYEGDPSIGRL